MKKRIVSFLLAAVMLVACTALCGTSSAEDYVAPALKPSAKSVLEGGVLSRLPMNTAASDVKALFVSPEKLTVSRGGNVLADGDAVKTGATVTDGTTTVICAVNGDTDGNAKINVSDVTSTLKLIANWDVAVIKESADANLDGKVNLSDVTLMLKFIAGWDVTVGARNVVFSDEKIDAEYEDPTLSLAVHTNMPKYDRNTTDIGKSNTVLLNTAKNEIESCQVIIASPEGHTGIGAKFTQFTDGYGHTIETELTREAYVTGLMEDFVTSYSRGDILTPMEKSITVKAGRSQGFLIKAKTPADALPGLYEATVTFTKDGKDIKTAKIFLNVWDFALSEETACETAFGLSLGAIYSAARAPEDDNELYKKYYDFLLENRICAYYLPYKVTDPRCGEYLNNPRVNSFTLDGTQSAAFVYEEGELDESYEILKANPEWMDKAYFYYVDEPGTWEKTLETVNWCKIDTEKYPGVRNLTPVGTDKWFADPETGEMRDIFDYMDPYPQIWCSFSSMFALHGEQPPHGSGHFTEDILNKYGYTIDRLGSQRADGDKLWWYVCLEPRGPFANFMVNQPGDQSRTLFWQQYDMGVDGILYYSVTEWCSGNVFRTADNLPLYSGDGCLLYCGERYEVDGKRNDGEGKPYVTDGPLESIRLEHVRDGIEDYQYMKMAEELCGKEAVDAIVTPLVPDLVTYYGEETLLKAREALAEMILNALAK